MLLRTSDISVLIWKDSVIFRATINFGSFYLSKAMKRYADEEFYDDFRRLFHISKCLAKLE